ncbi:MAG: hypothetical protein JXB05_08575 [Myxococcaceae bacterium]|nr:hypothetical protein [Myxococcaceae bacterium]
MARALDIIVEVAPPLRNAFEGRSQVSLGVPATAELGDVMESLLRLYPRTRAFLAGDHGGTSGRYMHVALGAPLGSGQGLARGHKLFVFALSRSPASRRTRLEG